MPRDYPLYDPADPRSMNEQPRPEVKPGRCECGHTLAQHNKSMHRRKGDIVVCYPNVCSVCVYGTCPEFKPRSE